MPLSRCCRQTAPKVPPNRDQEDRIKLLVDTLSKYETELFWEEKTVNVLIHCFKALADISDLKRKIDQAKRMVRAVLTGESDGQSRR